MIMSLVFVSWLAPWLILAFAVLCCAFVSQGRLLSAAVYGLLALVLAVFCTYVLIVHVGG